MKKSIFLFFAAILCAIGMNAADIPAGTKLYLKPNSNWSGARYAVYFYGNGDTWVSMQLVPGESNIYEVTSPNKVYKNLIFCRMDPCDAKEQSDSTAGLLLSECQYTVHFAAQRVRWSREMGGFCHKISSYGFCCKTFLICIQDEISKLVQKGTLQIQWNQGWTDSCVCKETCQHATDDRYSQENGLWLCKVPQFHTWSSWNTPFRNGCSCVSAPWIWNRQ